MEKITVSAAPLRRLLQALNGPPHLIQELQATRDLDFLSAAVANPIDVLIAEYNAAIETHNAALAAKGGDHA